MSKKTSSYISALFVLFCLHLNVESSSPRFKKNIKPGSFLGLGLKPCPQTAPINTPNTLQDDTSICPGAPKQTIRKKIVAGLVIPSIKN